MIKKVNLDNNTRIDSILDTSTSTNPDINNVIIPPVKKSKKKIIIITMIFFTILYLIIWI